MAASTLAETRATQLLGITATNRPIATSIPPIIRAMGVEWIKWGTIVWRLSPNFIGVINLVTPATTNNTPTAGAAAAVMRDELSMFHTLRIELYWN
jgi:hypothetical protein